MTDFGRRPAVAAANVLLKTGQTTSYRDGDDGYHEAGWEGDRFTDNGDGTITDNATALMWPDDANGPGGNNGATANWEAAVDYAEGLDWKGHDDWRLSNVHELMSLRVFASLNPHITELIQNCDPKHLWTSTTAANNPAYAWSLWPGSWGLAGSTKGLSTYFICCRNA